MKKFSLLLIFVFVNSVFGDINIDQCGVFTNVLQTRKEDSKIKMKNGAKANIINTPGCYLNTGDIDQDDNSNRRLICGENDSDSDAQATGNYGHDLNNSAIFTWKFEDSTASEDVRGGSSYTVTNSNEILTEDKYNTIKQNWNHYSFTWQPAGDDIGVYKFDNILNTVTVDNVENKDVKIGKFITAWYDNTQLNFNQTPNKIEIYKLLVRGSNEFDANWEAKESIDITEMDIKSSSENNITLKAPVIRIAKENNNKMDLSNNNNHIVVYADKLYIGEIDFGQHNTLEIHPYTPGQRVEVYIRQVNFSSNSQIIMDSGDYHIKDVDIPGSGDGISLMKASDENQVVNVILDPASQNHDFEIGNNFGINSNGTNGDFGNNSPVNFRIFVNGDIETGGGGTTFNAIIYTTGKVDLGSENYVRGAISSYDNIEIGNNSKFYWPEGMEDENFAQECGVRYQNHYVCGIFPTPLNSYKKIIITGNNAKVCNSGEISYPENNLTGAIKCSINDCNGEAICERIDPPANTYNYDFPANSKAGAPNGDNPITLIDLKYGDLTYNHKTVTFNPQNTYIDNNETKVMLLGNVNVSKSTLNFEPGDYFFESLTIDNNNNNIVLPHGGPVRIFVKNDFNVNLNNFHLNEDGNASDLFIYVGGNFNSIGNGGGRTTFKGFIYVKGNTTLNNNSNNWKIYGAITSEGDLNITGNNPDFIGGSNADNLGYGECDMCYEEPTDEKGFVFNINGCPGGESKILSDIYVPIKANNSLNNVEIDELHGSNFSFNVLKKYEVVDNDGNHVRDGEEEDNDVAGINIFGTIDTSLFGNKKIIYKLGDDNYNYGPTNNDNYQQLHESTLWSLDFCKWYEDLNYIGHYDKDGKHYDVIVSPCETNNNNSVYTTGPFDAWDTFRSINDRNISTKVVNKEFNLTIASINKDNNITEAKPVDMNYTLCDEDNCDITDKDDVNITDWFYFEANKPFKNQTFIVKKAYKKVKVTFKVCADYNNTTKSYHIYSLNNCTDYCNSNTEETANNPCWRRFLSSDNFAIRPEKFEIDINETSPIKAGKKFKISFLAKDGNDNDTLNYNESVKSSFDVNISEKNTSCKLGKFSPKINSDWSFQDGEKTITTHYSEVGYINITIREINGSEFAKVDEKDTSDSNRFIKETNVTVEFIPHHFKINASFNNFKNSNFSYISNDLNMSSILDLNITAETEQNTITQNYNEKCYAKKFEVNISHSVVPEKVKIILYKEESNSSEFNVSKNQDINFSNLSENYFKVGDNNGTAFLKIRINFDKNYSNPVNEFNFTIKDINISDINGTFGNTNLDQNTTFRYGRIHVKEITGVGNEINTTFRYEYWDEERGWIINDKHSDVFGSVDFNNSYIGNKKLNESKISVQSGNISHGKQNITFRVHHSLPYGAKIHLAIDSWLWYHPLAKKYVAPSEKDLSCLTHPCLKVNFLANSEGWGGVETNSKVVKKEFNVSKRTVDINSSKSNVSKKEVKKINW